MAGILQQLMQGQQGQGMPGQGMPPQGMPGQGMPPQDQGAAGVPIPGQDILRMPSGQYQAMTPRQIFMSDIFGRGSAGQAADTIEEERNRLKRALDEASR